MIRAMLRCAVALTLFSGAAAQAEGFGPGEQKVLLVFLDCTKKAATQYSRLDERADVIAEGAIGKCATELSEYKAATSAWANANLRMEPDQRDRAVNQIVQHLVEDARVQIVAIVLDARLARVSNGAKQK